MEDGILDLERGHDLSMAAASNLLKEACNLFSDGFPLVANIPLMGDCILDTVVRSYLVEEEGIPVRVVYTLCSNVHLLWVAGIFLREGCILVLDDLCEENEAASILWTEAHIQC